MGTLPTFFLLFFQWSYIDWPISKSLWNIGQCPIEAAPLLDPQLQDRNKGAPPWILYLQFIYMGVELWANHMG